MQKKALDEIAKVVVEKAMAGEQWAVQEVANRYDGKPVQSTELTGKDGADLFGSLTSDELRSEVVRRLSNPEIMRAIGVVPQLKVVK